MNTRDYIKDAQFMYQSWESPMLNILLKKIDRLLYTAVLSCRLSIQIFDKMQKASDLGQLGYS